MPERKLFISKLHGIWTCELLSAVLIVLLAGCSGGAKKPVQTNLVSTPPAPTIQHGAHDVLGGSFIVEPGKYKFFPVTVTAAMKNASVEGNFTASGGNNDIEVFVLEESQYANWQNGHKFDATYSSGRVTAGKLNVPLPQEPGTYYVVFSNRFSYITNKAVVADVKLHYRG